MTRQLIASAPTLDAITECIARYYCGESKTLEPRGADRWAILWAHDGEELQGVEVRRAGKRYRFETYPEAPTYRTELTPTGEQTVIPGCERNASPKARQLDLFG